MSSVTLSGFFIFTYIYMALISTSVTTLMYLRENGKQNTYPYLEAAYFNLRSTKFFIISFYKQKYK